MAIRVAMFIEYFHPFVGGAERQLEQLAGKLIDKGVEVKVFTLHQKGLKKQELVKDIPVFRKYALLRFIKLPLGKHIRKRLDIPAYRFEDTYADIDQVYWDEVKAHRGPRRRTIGLYLYRFYLLGVEVVKWFILNILIFFTFLKERRNIEIVHCHLMSSPFTSAACRMGKLFGKKVLIKLGDVYDLSVLEKYRLSKLYRRNFERSVDVFVCIAEDIRKMLLGLGLGAERLVMIPNSVDIEKFNVASSDERQGHKERLALSDKYIVAFVGSLKRKKGLDILLRSWRELAKDNSNLSLVLVGRDDNHAQCLRQMVKEFGMTGSVRFEGEAADVSLYLRASDLFVLPSRSEGMSNALLEAISSGLPVISTAVGGAKDALRDGYNGLLVEPNKVEPLKEAIELVSRDKALAEKMGKNARRTAEEKYSLQKVSDDYVHLYRKLLLPDRNEN